MEGVGEEEDGNDFALSVAIRIKLVMKKALLLPRKKKWLAGKSKKSRLMG